MDSNELFRKTAENFRIEFLQDTASEAREALRTIIAARDLKPDEPIHTPLMAAIEEARKVVA